MKKTKKPSPKNDVSKEIRHLGVMIESTNDNVKLIAEQFGDLSDNVKSIRKTVDSHTEMIGDLATELTIVKDIVGSHTGAISGLARDLTIVKEDIEFIKGSLKKKVDVDEFSALERRVSLLEKHSVKR